MKGSSSLSSKKSPKLKQTTLCASKKGTVCLDSPKAASGGSDAKKQPVVAHESTTNSENKGSVTSRHGYSTRSRSTQRKPQDLPKLPKRTESKIKAAVRVKNEPIEYEEELESENQDSANNSEGKVPSGNVGLDVNTVVEDKREHSTTDNNATTTCQSKVFGSSSNPPSLDEQTLPLVGKETDDDHDACKKKDVESSVAKEKENSETDCLLPTENDSRSNRDILSIIEDTVPVNAVSGASNMCTDETHSDEKSSACTTGSGADASEPGTTHTDTTGSSAGTTGSSDCTTGSGADASKPGTTHTDTTGSSAGTTGFGAGSDAGSDAVTTESDPGSGAVTTGSDADTSGSGAGSDAFTTGSGAITTESGPGTTGSGAVTTGSDADTTESGAVKTESGVDTTESDPGRTGSGADTTDGTTDGSGPDKAGSSIINDTAGNPSAESDVSKSNQSSNACDNELQTDSGKSDASNSSSTGDNNCSSANANSTTADNPQENESIVASIIECVFDRAVNGGKMESGPSLSNGDKEVLSIQGEGNGKKSDEQLELVHVTGPPLPPKPHFK